MKDYMRIYQMIFRFLLIVFLFSACSPANTQEENLAALFCKPVSAKENWGRVSDLAKKWDSEAYLVDIGIPVNLNCEIMPYLLSAGFQSPAKNNQSILIFVEKNDQLSLHHVQHQNGVTQFEPIQEDNWSIDSGTALEVFLNQYGREMAQLSLEGRITLFLERRTYNGESIVRWRLSVSEKQSIGSKAVYFYIDAVTGDLLDINLFD